MTVQMNYREYPIIDQPIIGSDFQILARDAHLSSNIHLSDYRRVQLLADILRPLYLADNWTFSVLYSFQRKHYHG